MYVIASRGFFWGVFFAALLFEYLVSNKYLIEGRTFHVSSSALQIFSEIMINEEKKNMRCRSLHNLIAKARREKFPSLTVPLLDVINHLKEEKDQR